MIDGFKKFIMRGNVVDLAVGVVIGAAFGALVTSLVADIITPLIAAIFGSPDFSSIALTVNGSDLLVGNFINAIFGFIVIAIAIYFFVVIPLNKMTGADKEEDPTCKDCPRCKSEVAIDATKCAHCTSDI